MECRSVSAILRGGLDRRPAELWGAIYILPSHPTTRFLSVPHTHASPLYRLSLIRLPPDILCKPPAWKADTGGSGDGQSCRGETSGRLTKPDSTVPFLSQRTEPSSSVTPWSPLCAKR